MTTLPLLDGMESNPSYLQGDSPARIYHRQGSGRASGGERSGLWGELYKQMCNLRPRFTIIENVTGLLSGDNGRWFQRLLTDMAEGGFHVEWECIPASSIGAPHSRDRVYLVAYPSENGWLRIYSKANIKSRRNVAYDHRVDWFGCGEGVWSGWETETRQEVLSKPLISREDDGFSRSLDRLSALGNAIVPQIAYEIIKAILQTEGAKEI